MTMPPTFLVLNACETFGVPTPAWSASRPGLGEAVVDVGGGVQAEPGVAMLLEQQPGASEPAASAEAGPAAPEPETKPAPQEPAPSKRPSRTTSAPAPEPRATSAPQRDPNLVAEQQARQQAAAQQRAWDAAAEAQAKAQALAEKRAAQAAAAAQRAQASWDGHGRPNRLIIVKQRSVDLVTNGRLTRQVPRSGGALTLPTLHRFVPGDWLRIADGTADLTAAIVLTPGQSLTLGGDVRTVRLAGGPTPSDAASIYTGRDGSPCTRSP